MTATFGVDGTGDVTGVDLHLHDDGVLSGYVVAPDGGSPVVVDPGHPLGYDRLRTGIRELGLAPENVAAVVCSHVHLDHAGAAAALAEESPDLDVYIHERSAEHLVDPSVLVASSETVMGDAFDDVGAPDPLDADHLVTVGDRATLSIESGRDLELVRVGGHAPDALAAWDERSGTLFATETFGNYWSRADRWLPPATLPRFDVDAVRTAIDSLRQFDAERLCLSHFGVRNDPDAAFEAVSAVLDEFEARIPELYEEHDHDIDATERAVESELLGLDDYDDTAVAMQRRVQTHGFLKYAGCL